MTEPNEETRFTKEQAARILGISTRLIKSDFVTLEQIQAFSRVRERVLSEMPKPPNGDL
jgi:hypothetical protein